MLIMSTSVVHRRGHSSSLASKKTGQSKSHQNGHCDDENDDKSAKPLNLRPILSGILVSLLFILGVVFMLPEDGSTRRTVRSPSVNAAVQAQAPATDSVHHMVFSTGCTTFQDWQSYIFFYHAFKAGQPGHVTRIASGCKPQEAEELKRLHKERIEIMSDRFHLHLTPDFMEIKPGIRYKFANKPHGFRHWLENGLGYPDSTVHDDDIVILVDPDQMLLRPLVNDFTVGVDWKQTKDDQKSIARVQHGSPAAQLYGFGAQWLTKVNVTHVAGPNSPIEKVSRQEARDHYPLGPPYVGTARDMYKIAVKWCEFLPRVHDNYPHLLAEMFSYSLAAAHMELPHQVAKSFMVSDAYSGSEGWSLVDKIPSDKVCYNSPQSKIPYVLHYCQRYLLGKWFIGKYRLPKNFVSCESPLLMEPPSDINERFNYSIAPFSEERKEYSKPIFVHRHTFMICTMIKGLNEASEYFKKHNCPADDSTNFEKSLIFHETMEEEYL